MPEPGTTVPLRQNPSKSRGDPLGPRGRRCVAPNKPNWPGSRWAREIRNKANPYRSACQTNPILPRPVTDPAARRAKRTQFPRFWPENEGRRKNKGNSPEPPRPRRWASDISNRHRETPARQTNPISRRPQMPPAESNTQRAKQTQFRRFWPENKGRAKEQSQLAGRAPSNHHCITAQLWD